MSTRALTSVVPNRSHFIWCQTHVTFCTKDPHFVSKIGRNIAAINLQPSNVFPLLTIAVICKKLIPLLTDSYLAHSEKKLRCRVALLSYAQSKLFLALECQMRYCGRTVPNRILTPKNWPTGPTLTDRCWLHRPDWLKLPYFISSCWR